MTTSIDASSLQTLAELSDGDSRITVVGLGGSNAVILGRHDAARIEVYHDGGVFELLPDDRLAIELTDPQPREAVISQALAQINELRQAAQDQLDEDQAQHRHVLECIRDYAIDRHREGNFCADGLNEFLRTFNLPEYNPRVRVTYSIRGRYEVQSSESDARDDAEGRLGVDLTDLDDVIDGSDNSRIEEIWVESVT
jgi:hypothetical protein